MPSYVMVKGYIGSTAPVYINGRLSDVDIQMLGIEPGNTLNYHVAREASDVVKQLEQLGYTLLYTVARTDIATRAVICAEFTMYKE